MNSSKRTISFDVLRILSALSVILMHITSERLFYLPMGTSDWLVNAFFNSIAHFGVPVFVMISGALFLNPHKEVYIKHLYTHSIFRLLVILLVWNSIYGIHDYLQYKAPIKYLVWEIADGSNHLWFIPMLIGLYMLQPIILRWVKNASAAELKYFVIIFFLIHIVWETLTALELSDFITFLSKYRIITLFSDYAGYFVLGHIIVHTDLFDSKRKLIYITGAISFILNAPALFLFSKIKGTPVTAATDSFSVLTFFYAIAVFCLVYDHYKNKSVGEKKTLLLNAADAAFCSDEYKKVLKEKIWR